MGGSCQKVIQIQKQESNEDNDNLWYNFSELCQQISEEDSIIERQNKMDSIHTSKMRFTVMKQYNFQQQVDFIFDGKRSKQKKKPQSHFKKSKSPGVCNLGHNVMQPCSLGRMEKKKKFQKSPERRGILKSVSNSFNSSNSTYTNKRKVSFSPQKHCRTYKNQNDFRYKL